MRIKVCPKLRPVVLAALMTLLPPNHASCNEIDDFLGKVHNVVDAYSARIRESNIEVRKAGMDYIPSTDPLAGNLGPGPKAYAKKALTGVIGADISNKQVVENLSEDQKKSLRIVLDSWKDEVVAKSQPLRNANQTLTVLKKKAADPNITESEQASLQEAIALQQDKLDTMYRELQDKTSILASGMTLVGTNLAPTKPNPFDGVWRTSWGTIEIDVDKNGITRGDYTYKNAAKNTVVGSMQGKVTGGVFNVERWTERCGKNNASGKATLKISADGKHFSGPWSTVEGTTYVPSGTWKGDKLQ